MTPTQLDIFDTNPRPTQAVLAQTAANQAPMPARADVLKRAKSGQCANFLKYPNAPGFKDRTTSHDAAIKMHDTGAARRHRQIVYAALAKGPATAKELVKRTGLSLDNVRPRLTQLRLDGLIYRTGERRNGQHVLERVK